MKRIIFSLVLIALNFVAKAQIPISNLPNTVNPVGAYVPVARNGFNYKLLVDSIAAGKLDSVKVSGDTLYSYKRGVRTFLGVIVGGSGTDTTSLSNRINAKVSISDTAAMLTPYLRKIDTTSMLSGYTRVQRFLDSLSAHTTRFNGVTSSLALKLNITDTANIKPRLYAGSNVTIKGTYPDLTIAATGGGGGSTTGVKSIEIVGDSAYLKNDVYADTGNYVYGISGGSRGYKASKKMTFTNPVSGEVVMISADSLINGRKVDSIYRTIGKDSIIFVIAGTRYAIKDSTGGGGGTPGGSTTQVQYNDAGAFQGSANMTFDGTMLTLPGSSTQSALKAGRIEMQSLGVNNTWLGENVYYSSGWKARATGYTPMFYFPNGAMEFQTVSSTVSAGATTTPITRLKIQANGRISLGSNVAGLTAQAHLYLANGSNTLAPFGIYLTGADVLATPVAGTMEAKVDTLYWTGNDAVRTQLARTLYRSATLDFGSTAAQNSTDLTITVTGAADGDIVSVGMPNASTNANSCFTAWVSAANTVTVRFNNYSGGTIDPASGTFKVRVFK